MVMFPIWLEVCRGYVSYIVRGMWGSMFPMWLEICVGACYLFS